jgi:hypothetical protein
MLEKTNNIPICPICKKGTKREERYTLRHLIRFPQIYDENGKLQPTIKNSGTTIWHCYNCDEDFEVKE